jgi:hypothetical protein
MKHVSSQDPQILGVTLKYLVATATWTPRFVLKHYRNFMLLVSPMFLQSINFPTNALSDIHPLSVKF